MASAHTDTFASAANGALEDEYRALVDGCGVRRSLQRGKLALTGADALEFLNGQVTNELSSLSPGTGCYAAFLTHKGKMLGDLRILAVGDDEDASAHEPGAPAALLLDTERVALQGLFDMIRRFKVGYDVELHKRTVERGAAVADRPRRGGDRRRAEGLARGRARKRARARSTGSAPWPCAPTSASI